MNPTELPKRERAGDGMMEFSDDLQRSARELARNMGDDDLVALPVGEQPEALWLSFDPAQLNVLHYLELEDGRTLHIGMRKETHAPGA